jgi:hypothetical protein
MKRKKINGAVGVVQPLAIRLYSGSKTRAATGKVPKQVVGAIRIALAMREMATDTGRLRWLFEFANRNDLLGLSPEQLAEQYAHLFAFAANRQKTLETEMLSAEADAANARAWLFEIQEALRSGLRQVIQLDSPREAGFTGWETDLDGVKRRVRRGRSAYRGPLRTTFLAAVADVIADDREKRIELCAKSICKRFFWKVGRARYCSRSCADADRQKRWRTKEEEA